MLIAIGMVIIFVSAFFIVFTVDSIIKSDLNCVPGEGGKTVCNIDDMGFVFIIKTIMIGFFILIDIVTVYLIITNAMPGTYYMKREEGGF
jgi:hypothetical protein